MARCSKCNAATSMWSVHRPHWCEDDNCPEGTPEPESVKKEREEGLLLLGLRKVQEGYIVEPISKDKEQGYERRN